MQDFDHLPTPFRALATDLETGEPVVWRRAISSRCCARACRRPACSHQSKSTAGLLVDGGLVDNLPVDLARQMGVDRLIVVDVSFPLAQRAGIGSAFDITNQMIGIMVRRGTRESKQHLRASDVLIEPDLGAHDGARVRAHAASDGERYKAAREMHGRARNAVAARGRVRALRRRSRSPRANPVCRSPSCVRAQRSQAEAARVEAVFGDLVGKTARFARAAAPTRRRNIGSTGSSRSITGSSALTPSAASRSICAASPGGPHSCGSGSASKATMKAVRPRTRPRACGDRRERA